jgi:excisionase family DNA binding protein
MTAIGNYSRLGYPLGMEGIITASEAAEQLGVTRRRVIALIHAGKLPADRLGNNYAIRKADLAKVKDRPPGRPPGSPRKSKPK